MVDRPPPPEPSARELAMAAETLSFSEALSEKPPPRDSLRPSRREGARSSAYAVVTGEGAPGDVAASASIVALADGARYEPGPLLGQGGMGEVVLHVDHRIGRHVARKTLLQDVTGDRAFSRFVREARVQGQLEHPSVVPVYDFGVDQVGAPFFTMKRVRGETLSDVLEHLIAKDPAYVARFSRHKLLAAFRQVCLAIEYAHLRGVVHRDLKPSNIMLGDFGEVYVLDWGVAKLRSDEEAAMAPASSVRDPRASTSGSDDTTNVNATDRTADHDMIGTPAYMAPEQFSLGRNKFDPRIDVFSLGAVLFEMLTLTRYRPGASFISLLRTIVTENKLDDPTRPSQRVADVAPELDLLCAAALQADPVARTISAAGIAEILERYLEGDRDLGMRRARASELLASAREQVALASKGGGTRVDAMRDAIKALALVPDDESAQRLLLSLVVDGSGKLPPDAERDFELSDFQVDAHALKMAMFGLTSWFVAVPLAMWVGIRSWLCLFLTLGFAVACVGYIALIVRWKTRTTRHMLAMAGLLGLTLAMCACWLGPFVMVPVAMATLAILMASRCRPNERLWLILVWSAALLLPFGLELLHVLPPAYTFQGGDLILHARALALPEGPTLAALAYTSLSFMVIPMIFIGQLRDHQRDGDRRLFVQAWHLRQLFPASSDEAAPTSTGSDVTP